MKLTARGASMKTGKKACYPYPRPALTADVAAFAIQGDALTVLLIRRKREPFAGRWALPGGFVDEDEPIRAAALRELKEETGLGRIDLEELGAYGDPGRDPRGWVVSVAFTALVKPKQFRGQAGDDAAALAWFPVTALPPLAFDHERILADGLAQVRRDALSRIAQARLLPRRFEWPDLVRTLEGVLGACVDAPALKKQGLKSGWLAKAGDGKFELL